MRYPEHLSDASLIGHAARLHRHLINAQTDASSQGASDDAESEMRNFLNRREDHRKGLAENPASERFAALSAAHLPTL